MQLSSPSEDSLPVASFGDLLDTLATLTRNRVRVAGSPSSFDKLSQATPLQARAFELLHLNPGKV